MIHGTKTTCRVQCPDISRPARFRQNVQELACKTYRLLAARNDWDECSSYWRISGRLVCLVSPLDTAPEYAQTRFSTDTPADGLLENPDRRLLVRKNRLVYATHPHSLSRQRSPRGKGGIRGILSANVVSFGTEFHYDTGTFQHRRSWHLGCGERYPCHWSASSLAERDDVCCDLQRSRMSILHGGAYSLLPHVRCEARSS